jgi:hypothetical protein
MGWSKECRLESGEVKKEKLFVLRTPNPQRRAGVQLLLRGGLRG